MKAIIRLDIPDYQIGQKVSIYFPDTMKIEGVTEMDTTLNLNGTVLNDTDIDFQLETENELTKNQKASLYKALAERKLI